MCIGKFFIEENSVVNIYFDIRCEGILCIEEIDCVNGRWQVCYFSQFVIIQVKVIVGSIDQCNIMGKWGCSKYFNILV